MLFLAGGLSRSLQFTSINTLAYADVPPERLSRATSFAAVCQELSGSVGVTIAALGLEVVQRTLGGEAIDAGHFPPVFILDRGRLGVIDTCCSCNFRSPPAPRCCRPTAMKAAEPAKDVARLSEGHL